MTGRPGRRWHRIVAAVAVVVMALAVWFAGRKPASAAANRVLPVPVRTADATLTARPVPAAPPVPTQSSSATRPGAEERQICGGAWIKVGADGPAEGDPPDLAGQTAALRERTIARMRGDRDAFARAVATWLGTPDDEAALVASALNTRDPRVYGFAFQSCSRGAPGSACGLLSAGQWARLDPGNAAPWVYALDEATGRRDAAGTDAALFQIGQAQRNDFRVFLPALPVLDAAPRDDASTLAAFGVTTEVIGRMMAIAHPGSMSLLNACRGPALADANRRQVCERAAEVLDERSDDLVTGLIAAKVAGELSGSSDRQNRRRDEMNAYNADADAADSAVDALGCASLRRTLDRVREQALYGETGAIRRWIERSGLTPEELQSRSHAFGVKMAAAAASATAREAAAASAP